MNKETNAAPQVIYQPLDVREDEIDLGELFSKVWGRKKAIVGFSVLAVIIALGIQALLMLISPPLKEYSIILQYNFATAEQGQYPSGQKFSYNDIVSTKVLEQVYQVNELDSRNINFDGFVSSFTISPYSSNIEFIEKKYQGLLSNKKLTRPEIESLESSYLDEMKAARSRFVRISYIDNSLVGLPSVLIEKILLDIPKVWSSFSIEELGVLDLKISGADFYQPELLQRFEYLQILEYLKENASALNKAIDILIEDEIGGLVSLPKSDKTAFDLNLQLRDLMSFQIEPLFSTVTNLGITRDSEKALIYLENTIQNLEDSKLVLSSKAGNFELIINQYSGNNQSAGFTKQEGAAGGFAQYDSTFLDKFTSLIEEKNEQVFKQDLYMQHLDLIQQVEDVNGEIIKFKRAQQRLVESESTVKGQLRDDIINDIQAAQKSFEVILADYKTLQSVRNKQLLGTSSGLYQLVSGGVVVSNEILSQLKFMMLIAILVGVVAFMLATFVALVKRHPESIASPS